MPVPNLDADLARAPAAGYELLHESRPHGTLHRAVITSVHLLGLAAGGLIQRVRRTPAPERRGIRFRSAQLVALIARPMVRRDLAGAPFGYQLRKRLELLGPTYIKLGQILSLRRDLLPKSVTDELTQLLDQLPAVPYARFCELVETDLGKPVSDLFSWIETQPTGSASIAQIHRAATREGDAVIIKAVKPGVVETLERDTRLLRGFGRFLQLVLPRYQPKRVIDEFSTYTLREVDLRLEADNAERFATHFEDQDDVVFPRIFRAYSSKRVLTMEFLAGIRPDAEAARRMTPRERERLVNLGAEAVIKMIYRDGFFHADLHPGNLLVLDGPKAGFIDLGMVGRLDDELRSTLTSYYFCLSQGDAQGAARYLARVAEPLPKADVAGFQRAVEEVSLRWHNDASFEGFSLGQLILESVALGARYRLTFPVEMVLMVKALVTFESVGNVLLPGFDVAKVSRPYILGVLFHAFQPTHLAREGLKRAPEIIEALSQAPTLITEGVRMLQASAEQPTENPLRGVRSTIFGGFCMVAGAIVAASDGPWPLTTGLFAAGVMAAYWKR